MKIPARCLAAVLLATAAILVAADAAGATKTWNVNSGDWSNTAYWLGGLPTAGDNALIVNDGTATIAQPGESCLTLTLGSSAESGTIQMSAGGSLAAIFNELIGNSGPGSFVQTGGTHSVSNDLYLGNLGGASGTYTLSGGSLSADSVVVGSEGPGSFVQTGGTHSVSSELFLAYDTGSSGTYTLSDSGLLSAPIENIAGRRQFGNRQLHAVGRDQCGVQWPGPCRNCKYRGNVQS